MTSRSFRPSGRTIARSWALSAVAAELAFTVTWLVVNPIDDLVAIAAIILLVLLCMLIGMIPVVLMLLLCIMLLRRFAPEKLASSFPIAVALMIIGGGIAIGEVVVILDTWNLGTTSEFFNVMLLAGGVGGVVAGWLLSAPGPARKAKL